jgi:hypothetical protein
MQELQIGGTSAFVFRIALLAAVGDGRIQQRGERAAVRKRIVSSVAKPLPSLAACVCTASGETPILVEVAQPGPRDPPCRCSTGPRRLNPTRIFQVRPFMTVL